jgi:pimeloyl-ACP methyl ester carboxylesterase
VLLHGQPGSPADWLPVADRLPDRFHAIVTDRPGYGASQRAAGGFAANARAVLDELDSRGIDRAVLVGHSYGGGAGQLAQVSTSIGTSGLRRPLSMAGCGVLS